MRRPPAWPRIEHLNEISDEDLALAKQNGVVAVFTPLPVVVLQQIGMSEADAKSTFATEIDRLRAGHRIGVPIAFGSDAALALPELTRGADDDAVDRQLCRLRISGRRTFCAL